MYLQPPIPRYLESMTVDQGEMRMAAKLLEICGLGPDVSTGSRKTPEKALFFSDSQRKPSK
jgi:hypothetical protein